MPPRHISDHTVLVIAACAYLPLVFLGFGSDGDSYSVIGVARHLLANHRYATSRAPGFPTHELATAALLPIGGSIATNLGSLALSLIGLWALLRVCASEGLPHRDLVALFVASNPYYWVNSASTIDYVWAFGLSFAGLYCWVRGRPWWAGVLFGLAAGAHITSVAVPGAAILTCLLLGVDGPPLPRRQAPIVLAATMIVAAALYALPFASAGYSTAFFRPRGDRLLAYYLPPWGWEARGARWVYKNVYLFGVPAASVVAVWGCVAARKLVVPDAYRWIAVLGFFAVVATEVAFWIAPLEPAYLLPILPFVALMIAVTRPVDARRWLVTVILLQLLYAGASMRLLEPDAVHNATTARVRPGIERGVVVADVEDRIQGRLH